jgi:hypothetical protein
MPTVEFFHKSTPVVAGGRVTVCVKAYETSPNSLVILDDVPGEDSHEGDAVEGNTPSAQALPFCKTLIVDIAGRRGLSITVEDVTEVPAP